MSEEFQAKKKWPDGIERICDGSHIMFGTARRGATTLVAETPSEIRELMLQAATDTLIELSHHADPAVKVYVHENHFIAIDPHWAQVSEDA
jgi:hypothetical protein